MQECGTTLRVVNFADRKLYKSRARLAFHDAERRATLVENDFFTRSEREGNLVEIPPADLRFGWTSMVPGRENTRPRSQPTRKAWMELN